MPMKVVTWITGEKLPKVVNAWSKKTGQQRNVQNRRRSMALVAAIMDRLLKTYFREHHVFPVLWIASNLWCAVWIKING